MIFDYRASPDVQQNGATLTIRWPDGAIGRSQHLTYRLMVQYLLELASLGEHVTVLRVQ